MNAARSARTAIQQATTRPHRCLTGRARIQRHRTSQSASIVPNATNPMATTPKTRGASHDGISIRRTISNIALKPAPQASDQARNQRSLPRLDQADAQDDSVATFRAGVARQRPQVVRALRTWNVTIGQVLTKQVRVALAVSHSALPSRPRQETQWCQQLHF
jgi:hypothetical protein